MGIATVEVSFYQQTASLLVVILEGNGPTTLFGEIGLITLDLTGLKSFTLA